MTKATLPSPGHSAGSQTRGNKEKLAFDPGKEYRVKIHLQCQRFKPNQSRKKPRKGYPGSVKNYTEGPGQRFNSCFSTAVPKQSGIFSQGTNWNSKFRVLPRERLNQAVFL